MNWNEDAWVTWGGLQATETDMSEICQESEPIGLTLFPLLRNAQDSLDLCEVLGGEMAVAKSKKDV